jgi:uncharacterized membrane protein YfcA
MTTFEPVLLAAVFFGVAVLYASVGNAGASGYLAVMALVGMAPDVMKPTALLLNIIVSAIATVRFHRAGYFSWKIFWPFTLGSVPFAAVGGALSVPGALYSALVGLLLLVAAYRLLFHAGPARGRRRPGNPDIERARQLTTERLCVVSGATRRHVCRPLRRPSAYRGDSIGIFTLTAPRRSPIA